MTPVKNFILILFISCNSIAQTAPFYESYNWEITPSYQIEGLDNDMVAIKDKVVTEFYFEDQNLTEYYLEHKILWLNSDDRIEEYNKIYLPFSNNATLHVSKARVIKKTGEVIELDESKILSAENEESGRKYKYFALEGIEKESIIEYYYVVKRYFIIINLIISNDLLRNFLKKSFEKFSFQDDWPIKASSLEV